MAKAQGLLLRPDVRLLTLTGPGGVGKTRLAQQITTELRDQGIFADGIAVIALADIRDPALVTATIAHGLGLRERGDRSLLARLTAELEAKRLLLLLDNFEHVLEAAPEVVSLLVGCPWLKALVTSRAALQVRGEYELPVPPLDQPAPPANDHLSLDRLAQVPAAALFLARAQAVRPDFALNAHNATAVAQICIRLDGLPLALELAAARCRIFSPQVLMQRLEHRLDVLTDGPRDLPERQKTLRQTIAWSYDLLALSEQAVFQRLAVFGGGWTLEAAEDICTVTDDDRKALLNRLISLMHQNLVQVRQEDHGEPRFGMLETIREYAQERLTMSDEEERVRRAHALYFLAVAEQADQECDNGRASAEAGRRWLLCLETEHQNMRAVLRWAVDRREMEMGLRLARALTWFWDIHGYATEGRAWLDELLAQAGTGEEAVAASLRAAALMAAADLAGIQADQRHIVALARQTIVLARSIGDRATVARALSELGNSARERGDYRRATVFFAESLHLWSALGQTSWSSFLLSMLGLVAQEQGDFARARALHEECLLRLRLVGPTTGIALVLRHLGELTRAQGDYPASVVFLEESLAMFRQIEDSWQTAFTQLVLGTVVCAQGDYTRAMILLQESLVSFRKLDDLRGRSWTVAALAVLARAQGDARGAVDLHGQSLRLHYQQGGTYGVAGWVENMAGALCMLGRAEPAARLFGAMSALRTTLGTPVPPGDQGTYDQDMNAIVAALGTETLTALWAEGQTMTLEQAIAFATAQTQRAS